MRGSAISKGDYAPPSPRPLHLICFLFLSLSRCPPATPPELFCPPDFTLCPGDAPKPQRWYACLFLGLAKTMPQRDKPDGAASKDHSFYLSKVKTCVVSVPSSRRGSKSSNNSDGAPTPTSAGGSSGNGGGDTSGFAAQATGGGILAPSPANAIVNGMVGRRGSVSSSSSTAAAAAAGLSSPLPSPSAPLDEASGGGAGARGFAREHDEADRGAGGGSGDSGGSRAGGTTERSQSSRSMVMPPPSAAAASGTARRASIAGSEVGAGGGEGPGSPGPRHRVLSIHFFGRAMTLDLWFASESEAVEWQVSLFFLWCARCL